MDIYYLHADHLNTPRIIIDTANNVVWSWQSDAFGNAKAVENTGLDGKPFQYNLRFPGQYYDAETGLHYNYFRDYNPQTGRYLQSDPIGLKGGTNTYGYVSANPLSAIDPTGEAWALALEIPTAIEWGVATWRGYRAGASLGEAMYNAMTGGEQGNDGACGDGCSGDGDSVGNNGDDEASGDGQKDGLPDNPDDLLKQGYEETSHPDAAKAGYRTFENPSSGDKVRFDQGKPGQPGYRGQDHYHRENPNATGKRDMYLDKNGNPCADGCNPSHLFPGD